MPNQDNQQIWDKLVEITGSPDKATEILRLIRNTRNLDDTTLTEPQRRLLDYLLSSKPILSQRQLARDAGFDHPQKMIASLAALVVKGHIIARMD